MGPGGERDRCAPGSCLRPPPRTSRRGVPRSPPRPRPRGRPLRLPPGRGRSRCWRWSEVGGGGDTGCPCGARPPPGRPTRDQASRGARRRGALSVTHTLAPRLFVPGQEHWRKWLESLGRHLTGAAQSCRGMEVGTKEVRVPAEGPLPHPPPRPPLGDRSPSPHRRCTLSESPESPEAHLPRGRGACHLRPSAGPATALPSLPHSPGHGREAQTDGLAPALVGPWGPPSSLVSLGLGWKVLSSAGAVHWLRKDQPPNEEVCSPKSVQRMPGLGQRLLGGRGRVLGSCPGHWELLFGGA